MISTMKARMSTRGRVTLPVEARRKLGIQPGTKLIVREGKDHVVVMTVKSYAHSLRGKYRDKGMLENFGKEKQSERLKEDGQA